MHLIPCIEGEVPRGLRPLLFPLAAALVVLAAASARGASGPEPAYHQAVLHQSGAVEKLWALENVIAVAFTDAATPDSYYDLAESENLLPRSELKYALADRAALYTLRDDQTYATVKERIERYPEVLATFPGLVRETLEGIYIHPGRFEVEFPDSTGRSEFAARLRREFGVTVGAAARRELLMGGGGSPLPAVPLPPGGEQPPAGATIETSSHLAVTLAHGQNLFAIISQVAAIPGVRSFDFVYLTGLVDLSDSYRVWGRKLPHWYTDTAVDEPRRWDFRRTFLPADSLLVVEYRRPPSPGERQAFHAAHGLRLVDPERPEYAETPPALRGRVEFLCTSRPATEVVQAIERDPDARDLVRGAIEALRLPSHELETVRYFRPRHFVIDFPPAVDSLKVEETLRKRGLSLERRERDAQGMLSVHVELPPGAALFQSIRAVRGDTWVRNARPSEIATDSEVELRAGHECESEAPRASYVDATGDTVRLHAIDRTLVLTFAAGASVGDRGKVAGEFGLTLLPMNQNLAPLARNLVYQVSSGRRSGDVAAAIRSRADLGGIVTGAVPGLFDCEMKTWVYTPENWIMVAFEPKTPETRVKEILARYRLVPAADPDRPAAEDPALRYGGAFWDYYVSRRIPLVATAGDAMDVLTRIGKEPGVIWAHPHVLRPSFDRGSRLFLTATGAGWYQHPKLDAMLNLLIHLDKTTSPDVVRGYAERAKLNLDGDRPYVIVQVDQSAEPALDALEALGFRLVDRSDQVLFGTADLRRAAEIADSPGVLAVMTKLVTGS